MPGVANAQPVRDQEEPHHTHGHTSIMNIFPYLPHSQSHTHTFAQLDL